MEDVIKALRAIEGVKGFYFRNLSTGETVCYGENTHFIPASLIKLPIFMAIRKMAFEGKIDYYKKIKITYDMRVPSCGAFNSFTDEPLVDIKTLCDLMIVISDNTAANVLIDEMTIDVLNDEFKEMGLVDTHVERKFYDDERQAAGFNNVATPKEIGELLEKLYRKKFINPQISEEILEVLFRQQCRDKIPAYLEDLCPIANKTGEAGGITCDAALVMKENSPFVVVFMFNKVFVPTTDEFIRHASNKIYTNL